MGRRPLVEAMREEQPAVAKASATVPARAQLDLFAPALTRVNAEPVGLSRMTWRDHVAGLHETATAAELPAWKLRFAKDDYVLLRQARSDAPKVSALVTFGTNFPKDFALPVLVQVRVYLDGEFAEETMVPATAIEQHLDSRARDILLEKELKF